MVKNGHGKNGLEWLELAVLGQSLVYATNPMGGKGGNDSYFSSFPCGKGMLKRS